MILSENHVAFGAPGIEPRWTSSAKEGVGTAYHTSCRLWFTISHGIVNEIYYPRVDQPNTRDFQFLITDGETFCHEEKRDLDHQVEYPEHDCLLYRLTNSDPEGRYRLVKHVMTDPHRSVLIVHTKVEVLDESLRGKLRLYALLAPQGADNSAWCSEIGGSALMHAQRGDGAFGDGVQLPWICPPFCRLRWRERRMAGSDGQLQNGLGIPRGGKRQRRADRRNCVARATANSPSPSPAAAAIRAPSPNCSNRWPTRLKRIARVMSASGSARW